MGRFIKVSDNLVINIDEINMIKKGTGGAAEILFKQCSVSHLIEEPAGNVIKSVINASSK